MSPEQSLTIYDHKVLDCPKNPQQHVDAWLSDSRLALLTTTSSVDPATANIIGSATMTIPLYDFNKPFQCPGCAENGCDIVLGGATNSQEIFSVFQAIKLVSHR